MKNLITGGAGFIGSHLCIGRDIHRFADGNDGGDGGNGSSGSDGSKNTDGSGGSKNTSDKIDDKSYQLGINKAAAKYKAEIDKLNAQLKEFDKIKQEIEDQKAEAEIKDLEKKKEYQKIIEKNQVKQHEQPRRDIHVSLQKCSQ